MLDTILKDIGLGSIIVVHITALIILGYVIYEEITRERYSDQELKDFFGYTDKEMRRKKWYSIKSWIGGIITLILAIVFVICIFYAIGNVTNLLLGL